MTQFDTNGVSDVVIQQVLARYLPISTPLRIDPLGNRGGFSGAKIWRVVTEQGDFALRRWPTPGLPRNRILGLHQLLEHLRGEGLNVVSVPLPTKEGITLLRDRASDWQLEPWMPGTADFHANPSEDRLRAAMTALAQWHLAASRFTPSSETAQWFAPTAPCASPTVFDRLKILHAALAGEMERVATRLRSAYDHSGATGGSVVPPVSFASSDHNHSILDLARRILDLFRRCVANAIRELELVRDTQVRLQPCLRDVWHDHVLFQQDRVTGLIDPAACRTETVACDLSRLIGSLVRDDGAKWNLALEEYHRWRPLTSGERALITVFNRSGVLLSGWTWLEWICLERRPFPDVAAVEKRLREILQRMSKLLKLSGFEVP